MTLEFNKVVNQVQKMGNMLDALDFDARQRLNLALDRFDHEATDLQAVRERIELARRSDISGYRGAAPLDAAQQAVLERTYVILKYGPLESVSRAASETWRLSTASLGLLGRMITGKASVRNLAGPISIAQMANESAKMGLTPFLFLLGLISLSLGILNLLPIPVLDGGHLLYYVIELFKGSPLSDRAQMTGQYIGLVSLAMLMSVAIVNDILRQIG